MLTITIIFTVLLAISVFTIYDGVRSNRARVKKLAAMTETEREEFLAAEKVAENVRLREQQIRREQVVKEFRAANDRAAYGELNPVLICPHCQSKGLVRTQSVKKKTGISGGKATAAILTGGISLLATGLSRKDQMTQARCGNCMSQWFF